MKHHIYIVMSVVAFAFMGGACSQTDDYQAGEETQTTPVEGIALSLESSQATIETGTRATVSGYSINSSVDPTKTAPELRTNWKLDFKLFYQSSGVTTEYLAGSFLGGIYDSATDKKYWRPVPTGGTDKWYFPNYFHPTANLLIYPDPAGVAYPAAVELDQSTSAALMAQDILFKNNEPVQIAHNMIYATSGSSTRSISVNHQRSMLDFIVSDVVHADIASVTVVVGTGVTAKEYTPFQVKKTGTTTGNQEYLLILPETTSTAPVVKIKTMDNSAAGASPITYLFTVGTTAFASNRCYYFTLQGNQVAFSPVTVTDWTTGQPVSGEYIAVTAYPTFKGTPNTTIYLYYDNKLTESNGAGGTRPKLQAVTFNNEGECTFKPDGRVITHIGVVNDFSQLIDLSTTSSTIKLDKMYIDLTSILGLINPPG